MAAMYRPSGDHRGERVPPNPEGLKRYVFLRLARRCLVVVPELFFGSVPVKTIELPSR